MLKVENLAQTAFRLSLISCFALQMQVVKSVHVCALQNEDMQLNEQYS